MNSKLQDLTLIFADGASSGNPGPGGWGAIIATPDGKIKELGGYEPGTTNNRMELTAVIEALKQISPNKNQENRKTAVYTDSTYVIRGITQWIWAWQKRGWISSEGKDVANSDLWKQLFAIVTQRKVEWKYVRGHNGIPGNERVDEIAVSYSKGRRPQLYQGPLLQYSVEIHDIPDNTELPEMRSRETTVKAQPHCYLSLVGSTPMRHLSWKDCENRVKGRSGAKFKKAMTPEEEQQILKSWGFKLEDIPK